MYGAVSATLRRLGVRYAPIGIVERSAPTTAADAEPCGSPAGASLHIESRRNPLAFSFCAPSYEPQGRQFLGPPRCVLETGAQSQTPPAGQSASVGTPTPFCPTPTLWNAPS